eukprot:6212793-Pleurochrysis_carterae.AAC.4
MAQIVSDYDALSSHFRVVNGYNPCAWNTYKCTTKSPYLYGCEYDNYDTNVIRLTISGVSFSE